MLLLLQLLQALVNTTEPLSPPVARRSQSVVDGRMLLTQQNMTSRGQGSITRAILLPSGVLHSQWVVEMSPAWRGVKTHRAQVTDAVVFLQVGGNAWCLGAGGCNN